VVGCYVLFVSSCYGWGDGPGMADRYR
jgi:hypothetical protein